MNRYAYKDRLYTIKELSEMSGIDAHTLRDRLRRGFPIEQAIRPIPVHESVEYFCVSSYYHDWIGMSISELYDIYWKWCMSNEYQPTTKQGFSRQIKSMYPQIKTIPTTNNSGSKRIIRLRG